MRKTLNVILVIIILIGGIFSLTGCGKDNNKKENKSSTISNKEGEYRGTTLEEVKQTYSSL